MTGSISNLSNYGGQLLVGGPADATLTVTTDGTTFWAPRNESYTAPSTYFPDQSRKKLRSLVDHMPDSDAEKIIQKLFMEITKENSDFRLTTDVENALTQMTLDESVGEVTL